MPFIFPAAPPAPPSLALGLESIWSPGMLLSLQALWIGAMLYMGRSKTTNSTISFHVVHSEILNQHDLRRQKGVELLEGHSMPNQHPFVFEHSTEVQRCPFDRVNDEIVPKGLKTYSSV